MLKRKEEVVEKPETELDWLKWYEYEKKERKRREEFIDFVEGKTSRGPLIRWLEENRE